MPTFADKIPDDFVPELTRGERVVGWFVRWGSEPWLRRVRWVRVGGVVAGLGVVGYLGAATVAYGFVRYYRHVDGVRFTDILLPTRWDNYRVARGLRQIAEAQRFVEERKFMEAFLYARSGVASAPAHRDGRLLLVEMLLAAKRPDDARRTLLEGLGYHAADPVYLKPTLTFLLQRQEDSLVVALARRHLPAMAPGSEPARLLALGAATASFFRGNYDQAEDFLGAVPKLVESRDGRLLAAKIEWDRGYRELALVQFRQLAAELPGDQEVHRELVGHLRQHGLLDEARRSSLSFQIAFPALAGPRIQLLYAYRQAGDNARVAREAEVLLTDFANDEGALLGLADFAANAGDVALMQRIANWVSARGLRLDPFAMLLVETLVVARDYQSAVDTIRRYRADFPAWERNYGGLFDSLQAAALLGLKDDPAATMYLNQFLGQANLRADNLLAVANRFVELGAEESARRVLARAVEVDPRNQAALTRLVELDVTLNAGEDLAVHVRRLVQMRRPSPDILRVVHYKLGSDLFLFSKECAVALDVVNAALVRSAKGGARR